MIEVFKIDDALNVTKAKKKKKTTHKPNQLQARLIQPHTQTTQTT